MGIGELASTREARERDDGNERRARAGSDGKEKEREGKACQILCLPPPQAFPRLSGDRGTREHARSAREG